MSILWEKTWLNYLLLPLAFVFRGFMFLRSQLQATLYSKKNPRYPIPVVVIGNLTVGGSGKTPLVIAIAQFLQRTGWRPGIISRGYKGKAKSYPCRVNTNSHPREVGDEALLLARQSNCPVVVDPKRNRAVRHLLARSNCNVILSDDGLQHFSLTGNIEIISIDGQRRFGNGFCLPAGPLRESLVRLKTADFIVAKDKHLSAEFKMELVPAYFYQLTSPHNQQQPSFFADKRLHAVAGIGHPKQFFDRLKAMGLNVVTHPFPDHHLFKANDFNYGKEAIILLTEKDAVKCQYLADARIWCLKTSTILDPAFLEALSQKITKINDSLRSSLGSL